MGRQYDNLRLEKGMYREAGRSFAQVLEQEDPSEQYKGTALEGLDAYQRQLKRFDIKVKGPASDVVEKFFCHLPVGGALPRVHRPLGTARHGGEQSPAQHHCGGHPF